VNIGGGFGLDEVAVFLLPTTGKLTQEELQAIFDGLGYDKDQAKEALGHLMMGEQGDMQHPQFDENMELLNKLGALGIDDNDDDQDDSWELLETPKPALRTRKQS
jgi:hypothetical protein